MRPLAHLFVALALTINPAVALADDAGVDGAADATTDDGGEGIRETTTPDNWGCSATPIVGASATGGALVGFALVLLVLARSRRRRVLLASSGVALLATAVPVAARAEPPAQPSADALREVEVEPPPMRRFTIALSPLGPMVARWGGSLELTLASHHAIGLSGAYVHSHTNEDTNNVFRGGIGEIGYRYYFGEGGARGFFLGPSFILGRLEAVPERGASTSYWNLGGALDAGFSALVADRVLFALGAGVQYTAPTATFPAQELPASIYARPGVRPRLLLAIGIAF